MTPNLELCYMLLTYKNKVLLMIQEYDFNEGAHNSWSMIDVYKTTRESFNDAIIRKIKKEMKIELNAVDFLSVLPSSNRTIHLYHGRLSDHNVNNIERAEGQEIQFFSLKDVETLSLTPTTKYFFTEHRAEIEQLLVG